MSKETKGSQLEMALLSRFNLSPGITLKEAARGYIANTRAKLDQHMLLFVAACAIEAGDDALAAIILGVDKPVS